MLRVNLCIAIFLLLYSCKKKEDPKPEEPIVIEEPAPTACFNADNYFQSLFKPINFTNCSENYERSEWNFGNGAYATISEPTIVYNAPGLYNVTLKTFRGTKTAQITKKVVSANSVRATININYVNFDQTQQHVLYVKIYWRRKNENVYHYIRDDKIYTFGAMSTVAFFDLPESNNDFLFLTVIDVLRYPAPSPILSKDSLFTEAINVFNGANTPTGSNTITAVKIDYKLTTEYKP